MCLSDSYQRRCERRIQVDGALEFSQRLRGGNLGCCPPSEDVLTAQVRVMGRRIDRARAEQPLALPGSKRGADLGSDRQRGFALELQDIAEVLLVRARPEMSFG